MDASIPERTIDDLLDPSISVPRSISPALVARGRDRSGLVAMGVVLLVALGSLALLPLWQVMARVWASDPLRSVGAIFPVVSLIGVVAAWRRLGWRLDGSFWGLLPVALSIPLARLVTVANIGVVFEKERIFVTQLGPVLFLYGAGATLLFGGRGLLRAAIAPLCLLLFINPVPHFFNSLVDLPLQQLSALTARGFAHMIGLNPTGEQLRMMFAPDFGMQIVPGCNGVRGSITLLYLTLIFGYTRRLRPRILALTAIVACLSGYVLNLFRLCFLVIYYRIGIAVPSIQKYGVGVDYAIGCTLFLLATLALGLLIRSLEGTLKSDVAESQPIPPNKLPSRANVVARVACFAAFVAVAIGMERRSFANETALRPREQEAGRVFPSAAGAYRLVRTYSEKGPNGVIWLMLADYEGPGQSAHVNHLVLGLWVGPGYHQVAVSKLLQGVRPEWAGAFDVGIQPSLPIHFSTSFYDDGVSREYDAEAVCSGEGCSSYLVGSGKHGFKLVAPSLHDMFLPPDNKRLSILLRREWPDSQPGTPQELRAEFEADARTFTSQLDLSALLESAGSQP
jgi:exosortase J